jgi:hypothetical protein
MVIGDLISCTMWLQLDFNSLANSLAVCHSDAQPAGLRVMLGLHGDILETE